MSENILYSEKFSSINCLLCYFDDYDSNGTDAGSIAKFIEENPSFTIQSAINQGKQLLTLQDFPYRQIGIISNRLPGIRPSLEHSEPTRENYYNWIKWIIEKLEKEAKRYGKL